MTEQRFAAAMEARQAARRDLEARRTAARQAKAEAARQAQAAREPSRPTTLTGALMNRFAEDANPPAPPAADGSAS